MLAHNIYDNNVFVVINLNIYKVCGYVRVSTENQIENYSIDEQQERIKAYCKAKGWELVKIYTDAGYSGGNINRPELKAMINELKVYHIDAVIVYKLDRLSRSQKDTLTIIEDQLIKNSVDFISINENFDTSSPFGRAMIGILSVFAQLEKEQITERFTMGRIGRSKAGYYHGGSISPYGYKYLNNQLIINEAQAIIVKEIYNLFLSGNSINSISTIIEKKYNGTWSAAKIRYILKNKVYIGYVKFQNKAYKGNHIPIIDENTFTNVQNLILSQTSLSPQKSPYRFCYALSSLITCGYCGAKYSAVHGYYKCYSRSKCSKKNINDPNCKNKNWKISQLDEIIISEIFKLLSKNNIINDINSYSQKIDVTSETNNLKNDLLSINNKLNNLIDQSIINKIPNDILSNKISTLINEKSLIEDNIKEVSKKSIGRKVSIQMLNELFNDAPVETKHIIISSLIEKIVIYNNQIQIKWRL